MKFYFILFTILLIICIIISLEADAETFNANRENYNQYITSDYISFKNVFTELPETGWTSFKMAFSKESVPYWGLILGSSAILYKYDENILSSTQETGRKWGVGNEDNTHPLFQIGPYDVRFPTDTGSSLYFLGDGITHLTIAGTFIGVGHYTESPKAWNTGMQLLHGMAISTFFSQALKRSFGRESPVVSTKKRGAWRPFPSIREYNDNTPKYDAMPSGHIMTATLTFTIIIENYPEETYWLRPLEIVWLSALGLEMVNNGVHWASDYPLGIAMGYLYGKAALNLGQQHKEKPKPDKVAWTIFPSYDSENDVMLTNLLVNY